MGKNAENWIFRITKVYKGKPRKYVEGKNGLMNLKYGQVWRKQTKETRAESCVQQPMD
jgi:hypothetical protein